MKTSLLSLISLGIVLFALTLNAQDCANQANIYSFIFDGINYEIVKENQTWVDAAACAVERGGILCEVNSQDEQDTLFAHLNNAGIDVANTVAPDGGGASYVWLGGNDIAEEGVWIWDGNDDGIGPQFWEGDWNGTPVGGLYNNWGGEPDNWNNQDGLGLALTSWPYGDPGQWNDVDDGNELYYVIEYDNTSGINSKQNTSLYFITYPNPAGDYIKIDLLEQSKTISEIEIYNQMGTLVGYYKLTKHTSHTLNISHISSGVYTVRVTLSNGQRVTDKIMIQ